MDLPRLVVLIVLAPLTTAAAEPLSLDVVNKAEWSSSAAEGKGPDPVVIKAQILLDRARFAPGVVDGRAGENFEHALAAFEKHHRLDGDGKIDETSWAKLEETSGEPVLKEYTIADEDVKGPFVENIPAKFERRAKLARLGYTSAAELLAEKFHMNVSLLKALNPGRNLDEAGTSIVVAAIATEPSKAKVKTIEVHKREKAVRAFDKDGGLVAFYPASIGSEESPAPSGTHKVRTVVHNPVYRYDPARVQLKGVSKKRKLKIAPGPNNPVGSVWIGLSKDTYGIHGTPDPDKIGKTASNGCVRLTNWDAETLAGMIDKGTVVKFVD